MDTIKTMEVICLIIVVENTTTITTTRNAIEELQETRTTIVDIIMVAINNIISRLDNSSLMEEAPEAAITTRATKATINILNSIIINIRTAKTVAQAEEMVSSTTKQLQLSSAILSPTTHTGTSSLSSLMLAMAMQATMLKTTAAGIED